MEREETYPIQHKATVLKCGAGECQGDLVATGVQRGLVPHLQHKCHACGRLAWASQQYPLITWTRAPEAQQFGGGDHGFPHGDTRRDYLEKMPRDPNKGRRR